MPQKKEAPLFEIGQDIKKKRVAVLGFSMIGEPRTVAAFVFPKPPCTDDLS